MITNNYYELAKKKLFKLNRSITGKDTEKTLKIIKKNFTNLKIKKVKSGTKVYDWVIPPEWNIFDAYVKDKYGNKIINFKQNNLHLVSYSKKVSKIIKKDDLIKKLYTSTKLNDSIPYVTSYYKKDWGFCVSNNFLKKFKKMYKSDDKFKVIIDSEHNKNGKLQYGEVLIGNKNNKKEILISTYICHPSMANNELSGPIVAMYLMKYFKTIKLNFNLRFIFVPETIGSIIFINKNFNHLKNNIIGGFNLTCCGDERNYSCILSPSKRSPSDLALIDSYKKLKLKYKIYDFLEAGSDERQYNYPGVDLGITVVCRSMFGKYKEYHTSKDNFSLVTKKGINGTFKLMKKTLFEINKKIFPKANTICEPKLDKYDLIKTLSFGGQKNKFLDLLRFADGRTSLQEISKKIKLPYYSTKKIFLILKKKHLIT